MICEKCRQEYDGNMAACPYCGNATPQAQPQQQYQNQYQQPQQNAQQYQQPQQNQQPYGQPQQNQQPYARQNYQPQYGQYQPMSANSAPKNMSTASMVCGIIGLILCWVPFLGLVINALAIIFCILSKKEGPNGMATAGLVCGIIGMIPALIMAIGFGFAMSVVSSPWYW